MNVANGFIGTVTEIRPETGEARVKNEAEGYVTSWLGIIQLLKNSSRNFEVNDQVFVMMDQNREDGLIVGFVGSDEDPPPLTNKDEIGIVFPKVTIKYNRSTGAVYVKSDNVTVEGKNLNVKSESVVFSGDIEVKGKTKTAAITSSSTIFSTGLIKSDIDVQGALIKLSTHTHTVTGLGAPTGPSLPT